MSSGAAAPWPGILAIFNNVAPGREADFEEWFQHEHLAERIAVPGFLLGRRHEAVAGEPRYFNFYVTPSRRILKSAAYLDAARPSDTDDAHRHVGHLQGHDPHGLPSRLPARAAMRGAGVVAVRFAQRPDEALLQATIERLMRGAGGRLRGNLAGGETRATFRYRGRALARRRSQIEACLLVETLRLPDAERIAASLAATFPDAEIGVYRLLCDIRADSSA